MNSRLRAMIDQWLSEAEALEDPNGEYAADGRRFPSKEVWLEAACLRVRAMMLLSAVR